MDKNYCTHVFFEECKYILKDNKMSKFIDSELETSSDESNEEVSDEETSDKE